MTTFQLPVDGEVHFARWMHPGERPKTLTQSSVDALRAFLRPGDVAIDTAGALIAVVLVRRRAGLARLPPPREATSTSPEALPRPAGSTTTPPATDAASRRP